MKKSLSFRMTLSLISVTVLVVLMTCLVFTLLFENYAVSDREETLTACAEDIARVDREMMDIRRRLEESVDEPTEDDILIARLKKLDTPIL